MTSRKDSNSDTLTVEIMLMVILVGIGYILMKLGF